MIKIFYKKAKFAKTCKCHLINRHFCARNLVSKKVRNSNSEQVPSSNGEVVPSSNGQDATPNEPAKVKLDGLFMFYVDNELTFIPEIKEDMEFPANKVLLSGEDGSGLDVDARNWYEHYFDQLTCGPLSRYGGL